MCTIGEKIYSSEDQHRFAQLSHDCNPMHMDAIVARRLLAGRQVVHGIHILFTALEFWKNDSGKPLVTISCTFNNPVSINENVIFSRCFESEDRSAIEVRVNDLVCATMTFTTGPRDRPNRLEANVPGYSMVQANDLPSHLSQPVFHLRKAYALRLNAADFSDLFPGCHHHLGKHGLASTAALSYFVGMVCPGLHSVFSSLSVDLDSCATTSDLHFSVRKYDPRFQLFDIGFTGCIQGGIKAFTRPPPQVQPSMQQLSKYVDANEFKGTRALIIGGSRGLGEVTAKVLAAGGGDVTITYALGLDDAKAISVEIDCGGRSQVEMQKFDLTTDPFESIIIDWNTLNTIYFFATPRIFRKKSEVFESALFHEFCEFYIEKLYGLCVFLEKTITTGTIKVYVPSTIAVTERPKGIAEYAMAKAAAEIMVQEINRDFRKLTVLSTRLPRLGTDQTATILKVPAASNVETLLPVIRAMQA